MADKATDQIDFVWKGKDKKGVITSGELSAKSEAIARSEIRRAGIRLISIKKKPQPLFTQRVKPITSKDLAIFSRQLATMLGAGVPLVQSFDIIGKGHDNASMSALLLNIKADIESGDTLAEALNKHPMQFNELYCNLVRSGEQAGVLETLLGKIATYQEKSESIKAKVKKALTYPIAVLVVAVIVTAILLIFVVPVFKDLFKSFGADLPAFTVFVVGLSEWAQQWWYVVVGIIGVCIYTFGYFKKRSRKFCHALDRILLKIPVVGMILNKSAVARFARTLATMSAAGVPLIEALESVSGAVGNVVYAEAVMKMRESVSTGQRLEFSMIQVKIFPNMVNQMVAIGEESGSLDKMLDKVADFYEEEVDNLVDNLSSLMEPIIMAILGVLVGGLIIAMYLPIFKLGAAIH